MSKIQFTGDVEFINTPDFKGHVIKLTLRGLPFGIHHMVSQAFSMGITGAGLECPADSVTFRSKGIVVIENGPGLSFEENLSYSPKDENDE